MIGVLIIGTTRDSIIVGNILYPVVIINSNVDMNF